MVYLIYLPTSGLNLMANVRKLDIPYMEHLGTISNIYSPVDPLTVSGGPSSSIGFIRVKAFTPRSGLPGLSL